MHCFAWPYNDENPWANEIEALLLSALVALGIFQFNEDTRARYIVSSIILVLTSTAAGFYVIIKAIKSMRKKYCQKEAEENGEEMGQENVELNIMSGECVEECTSDLPRK